MHIIIDLVLSAQFDSMLEWGSRGLEYESHAFKNIMLLESGENDQKASGEKNQFLSGKNNQLQF